MKSLFEILFNDKTFTTSEGHEIVVGQKLWIGVSWLEVLDISEDGEEVTYTTNMSDPDRKHTTKYISGWKPK